MLIKKYKKRRYRGYNHKHLILKSVYASAGHSAGGKSEEKYQLIFGLEYSAAHSNYHLSWTNFQMFDRKLLYN